MPVIILAALRKIAQHAAAREHDDGAMSRRGRLLLFACAGPGLLAVLLIGLHGLPAFGDFHGAYGLLVDRIEPGQRHATDIVTALNFDLRAFDTLGEEFILFASVSGGGAAAAPPARRGRRRAAQPERSPTTASPGPATPLRVLSLILIPLLVVPGRLSRAARSADPRPRLSGRCRPGRRTAGDSAGGAIPRSQARGSAVGAGCTGRGRRHRVCADRAGWPDLRLGVPRATSCRWAPQGTCSRRG